MSEFDPKPMLSLSMCFIKNIDEIATETHTILKFSDDDSKMPISLLEKEFIENN